MTRKTPNHAINSGDESIHVVVATHSREVKTALFLALNAIPAITIVATATSTSELISYCNTFRPDTAIVESGLPGRPLGTVLSEVRSTRPDIRILLIDEFAAVSKDDNPTDIEVFTDLQQLIDRFPEQGADAP
ncbi:MAG: hypothetical protein BMS9Abin17_1152 [Acidimicrobiia bacterium]|nr:MAG: hypothetical protein BMS9Abin17_1152 [Acidimicrobiia bacterium]